MCSCLHESLYDFGIIMAGEANDMNDAKRDLPCGTGYKSYFMVVEGSTQKNVSEAFLQGRKMKYTYDAKFINNEIDRLECK